MYHIKKDGKLLCGKKLDKKHKDESISFSNAYRCSLIQCCAICQTKFRQLMGKITDDSNY